jgi:hypothetical protein
MTKQSFDPTVASTSKQELESETASDDNENSSTTASITRRMSASGKRKKNKRGIDFKLNFFQRFIL